MLARTNAQRSLGIRPFLSHHLDLSVEVRGRYILVEIPGGNFRVVYAKSPDFPQLILESEWWSRHDPVRLARLRAHAWRLANDAASELGWFKDA
jgi:hypothetical protein